MIRTWLRGLVRRQPARLAAPVIGVATTVALLALLGVFLAGARASMTSRAVRSVGVDWQVKVSAAADPAAIQKTVDRTPHVLHTARVGFASVSGLQATDGTTQASTASAVLLGLPSGYSATFPGQLRVLTGTGSGVVLAQQTAANLHAGVGSRVRISVTGSQVADVRIAGVVDLPQANSLFQKVGAPATAQPSAPPDNVVLLPFARWQQLTRSLAAQRPDAVEQQVHVALDHRLPTDPAAAYAATVRAANNLEARTTGAATVGDNLAAALDGARGDAAYAQLLFGFLGAPGAVLAGLLTGVVMAASSGRRRREQSLLRQRGASLRTLFRMAAAEAVVIGVSGCVLGLGVAAAVGGVAFGSASPGTSTGSTLLWAGVAVVAGLVVTLTAVLVPIRRSVRGSTVVEDQQHVRPARYPWWARYGLDVIALVGGYLVLRAAGQNDYQLVQAPEGVATISVSYWALAAPALLWFGFAVLAWRLADVLLGRGRRVVAVVLRPFAGGAARAQANSLSRTRSPLVRAAVLVGLALAFAISTSTFNATYRTQAEADAKLTNGADVTVSRTTPGGPSSAQLERQLRDLPGVTRVEPMRHRFAYVGADLQDLYGVRPGTIRAATAVQDSYFVRGGTAARLMQKLQRQPDSILVSAETVTDYQLHLGDQLRLRMVDGRTGALVTVPFRYAGIVAEFPTAPKDSFFVANGAYVAARTRNPTTETFLVDTAGGQSGAVASRARAIVGNSATVSDITTVRATVGSSLTAVDLSTLTTIELAFAAVLAAAAAVILLTVGVGDRRRSLAIMRALGAPIRHIRGYVTVERLCVAALGGITGVAIGSVMTSVLVSVLTGVFDPPPSGITVPWLYLTIVFVVSAAALAGTSFVASRIRPGTVISVLRD